MIIESIEIELDITTTLAELEHQRRVFDYRTTVEANLQNWGEPLRWAITSIDPVTNIAKIEAIVIRI
jgi:hypothetical protein